MKIKFKKHRESRILKLIIILFFAIRLIGIANPPLETGHNWRQTITNMVTRNMVQENPSLLYPKIDMAGDLTGISASEFPIYNFITYLFSLIFGFSDGLGRVINLLVSSIGIFYFYKILEHFFSNKIALYSSILLLTSLWFSFSRKIMPDTFSVSLIFIGVFYGLQYLKNNNLIPFLLFLIFTSLGVLSKLPSGYLLVGFVFVLPINTIETKTKVILFLGLSFVVFLAFSWYFYWVPTVYDKFHYQLFFPKSFAEGFTDFLNVIPQTFQKFYFSAFAGYLGFVTALLGVYFLIEEYNKKYRLCFLLLFVVFLFYAIKTGNVFATHNYYVLPFAPVLAILAALFITKLPKPLNLILLCLISIEGIANQQHDFFIKDSMRYKLNLEQLASSTIEKDALIIINGGESPQELYFTNRKGWTVEHSKLLSATFIDSLVNRGANYLILDKKKEPKVTTNYPIVYTDDFFEVIKLKE